MSIKPVFPTIPRNSMARQQHSQYPKMWLDPSFTIRTWQSDAQLLSGVSARNYIFCGVTVPIGMRAIVTRVSYMLVLSGNIYPLPTDRVFLRNRTRETSRFDYDRFTNNVNVPAPPAESGLGYLPGSYQNPETVDVYDFGNSGDTLIYGVNGLPLDTSTSPVAPVISPNSFVEIDYLLVPPNHDVYMNAQDEGSTQ